jgi:hypothetical protein
MTTFLTSLLPASLFIFAVHILFQEGHLFEGAGKKITQALGERWSSPLINCPICMASVWGSLWFFLGLWFTFEVTFHVKLWIPYIMCLCGLNYLLNKLISKEVTIKSE